MDDVFDSLRALTVRPTERLHITDDDPAKLTIEGDEFDGMREGFGAVQTKKNCVSYHLMQVHCEPALLDDVSADLKKRMQASPASTSSTPTTTSWPSSINSPRAASIADGTYVRTIARPAGLRLLT